MVDWRKVALLALVALAAAVVGLAVLPSIGLVRFGSAVLGINAAFTPAILAADIASGLTLFAAGLIAWIRQPANPIWRLMIAAYFADYLWQLAFVPPPLLLLVGIVIVAGTLGLDAIVAAALSPPVWVVDFILPVAFLIGALRLRMARASIASAVLELGSLPTPARLQEILRRRVGDPSLLVLRWSQAQGVFVDDDGRPVEEAPAGSQQTLTVLERDGRKAAAVLHDSALADDAILPQAIVAAAAMIMEATDIRDELRARGGQTDGLPSGDVTFVFADIEQSTALLDSLGPMYASVLGDLRRLASDIADQHGGRLVDAIGDELFLAFPVASAAVMGAVELTRRLARTTWPDDAVVRVRIGIHTGRPELTQSGYVGMDVHRAARIMAMAKGGEIIASAAAVSGLTMNDSAALRPLGRIALRGIAEPLELVAVEAR